MFFSREKISPIHLTIKQHVQFITLGLKLSFCNAHQKYTHYIQMQIKCATKSDSENAIDDDDKDEEERQTQKKSQAHAAHRDDN